MFRGKIGRALAALLSAWVVLVSASGMATAQTPATESTTQAQITGAPLVPGSTAIVIGGDCLRLRDGPSVSANRITCIPDGRTVTVLPLTQEADGYRWQMVQWRELTGWVADAFLAPYDGPPQLDACQTDVSESPSVPPGLAGDIPVQGGFGLVVWGGGTVNGIEAAATTAGCHLTSVWSSVSGGGLIGYRFGAPAFVNSGWTVAIQESIPAGTPLLIVCAPPGQSPISVRSVIVPAATGGEPFLTGNQPAPNVSARAAVVIDEASGAVLFEENAHLPLAPASLTKIATAIVAMESSDVNSWVDIVDVDWRNMPGSSIMGIIPGDCFTVSDLLYGLMLPSGNDAALALARHTSGSDEAFVDQMNLLLVRLGLVDSHFTDPHGLGSPQHRMSAYDIGMLSRYGMTQLPLFRAIVGTRSWTAVGGDRDLSMLNVNSFLGQFDGGDGVKTGFTEEAGRTLSASAVRDGRRLYAVILNDDDRYEDAADLMDWAFDNYTWP